MAADKDHVLFSQQFARNILIELPSLRTHEYCMDVPARPLTNRLMAKIQRLREHHETFPSAIGIIIRPAVIGRRIIANIGRANLNQAALLCLADHAGLHHGVNHIREQRHDINGHPAVIHRLSFL